MFGRRKEKNEFGEKEKRDIKNHLNRLKDEIAQREGKLRKEFNADEKMVKNMIRYLESLNERNADNNKRAYQRQLEEFINELNKTKHIEAEIEEYINKLEELGHSIGAPYEPDSWIRGPTHDVRGHLVRGKESTLIARIRASLPQLKNVVYGSETAPTLELLNKILKQLELIKKYEKGEQKYWRKA